MGQDRIIVDDIRNISRYPELHGQYNHIDTDNPWWHADQRKVRLDTKTPTKGIGACHHYDLMKTDELCQLEIGKLAAERCHLYMWCTCPLLPDGLRVMREWGFKYSTIGFVWVKMTKRRPHDARAWYEKLPIVRYLSWAPDFWSFLYGMLFKGPGFFSMSNVEVVLLGWKGKPFPHRRGHKAFQVILAPQTNRHSEKPDELQDRIDESYPEGKRIELFARRPRKDWDVFGFEADGKSVELERT